MEIEEPWTRFSLESCPPLKVLKNFFQVAIIKNEYSEHTGQCGPRTCSDSMFNQRLVGQSFKFLFVFPIVFNPDFYDLINVL